MAPILKLVQDKHLSVGCQVAAHYGVAPRAVARVHARRMDMSLYLAKMDLIGGFVNASSIIRLSFSRTAVLDLFNDKDHCRTCSSLMRITKPRAAQPLSRPVPWWEIKSLAEVSFGERTIRQTRCPCIGRRQLPSPAFPRRWGQFSNPARRHRQHLISSLLGDILAMVLLRPEEEQCPVEVRHHDSLNAETGCWLSSIARSRSTGIIASARRSG